VSHLVNIREVYEKLTYRIRYQLQLQLIQDFTEIQTSLEIHISLLNCAKNKIWQYVRNVDGEL